jgi:hypothetical protein
LAGQIDAFQFANWVNSQQTNNTTVYGFSSSNGGSQGQSTSGSSTHGGGTGSGTTSNGGNIQPSVTTQTSTSAVTIYPPPAPVPCPPELPPPGACDTRQRDLLRDYIRNAGYEVNHAYVYNTEQARRLAKRIVKDLYGLNNSRVITVPVGYELAINTRVKFRDYDGKVYYGRVHLIEVNVTKGQATKTITLYKVRPEEGTNDG